MLNTNRIKERIKERKTNVETIAKKIGISNPAFYSWLKNESDPKLSNIIKMCDILDLDLNEVVISKKKGDPCMKESKEEEILTIYKNLNEKEKNLLLALAKNVEILYNNDCVQNNEIKQARLAQLAEHLTLNKDILEAYALLFFCEKSKKQSSIL